MQSILVIEDSAVVIKVLKHVLSKSTLVKPVYAASFAEAKAAVTAAETPFFAALVDLTLPDAANGEVVDYTLELGIPTLVLTSSFDEKRKEALQKKGIVDYVTKEGRYSYVYALGIVHRLIKNQKIKVLVVDDSKSARSYAANLLKLHMYQVFEATDGVHAIQILLENPDIRLLITDYNMPRMDGFELTKNIRVKYDKSDLIIIGLSSEESRSLSARFLKNGANDFLKKPFNHEEFFCRVTQNIEFLELIEQIRDSAARDELTGLYNRQYFFSKGENYFQTALTHQTLLACAVIEIENLHEITHQYDIESGHAVVHEIAQRFAKLFKRFLIARGTENKFFILLPGLNNDKASAYVEEARQIITSEAVYINETQIGLTFSGGISNLLGNSLEDMVESALACLSRAKEAGSDLVFGDDLPEDEQ